MSNPYRPVRAASSGKYGWFASGATVKKAGPIRWQRRSADELLPWRRGFAYWRARFDGIVLWLRGAA